MLTENQKNNIQTIANRLSEKKITVIDASSAYTDGVEIYIPLSENNYSEIKGLVAHESFHLRAGSFSKIINFAHLSISKKYGINRQISRYIVNITEDFRVNQWIKKTYEGFYEDLNNFEQSIVKKTYGNLELSLLQQLAVFFILGNEIKEEILKLKSFKLSNKTQTKLNQIRENIRRNLSQEQGLQAAFEVAKIYNGLRQKEIEKNKQEKRKNKEQNSGNTSLKNQKENTQKESSQKQKEMEEKNTFDEEEIRKGQIKNGRETGKQAKTEKEMENQERLAKTIEKLKKGKLTEKELQEASEKAEEEIKKILETEDKKRNSKQIFKSKDGRTCERIIKREQIIRNGKNAGITITEILKNNKGLINKVKNILGLKAERTLTTRGHKTGRMNRDIIRSASSGYAYTSIYSKQTTKTKGKLLICLDLSGSMRGTKIQYLKEATIVLSKALENMVDLRIVGYSSEYSQNFTFVFKEFGHKMDMKKMEAIGLRTEGKGTPTGIAVETEIHYLQKVGNTNKIPVIVITDGVPDDLTATEKIFKKLKRSVKIYGIGIKCEKYAIETMFGTNYVSIKEAEDLKQKLINISKRIVKNF